MADSQTLVQRLRGEIARLNAELDKRAQTLDHLSHRCEQAVERLRNVDPVQVDMLNDSAAPLYAWWNGLKYRAEIERLTLPAGEWRVSVADDGTRTVTPLAYAHHEHKAARTCWIWGPHVDKGDRYRVLWADAPDSPSGEVVAP